MSPLVTGLVVTNAEKCYVSHDTQLAEIGTRVLCELKFLSAPAPHPQEFEKSFPLPPRTRTCLIAPEATRTPYQPATAPSCAVSVPNLKL